MLSMQRLCDKNGRNITLMSFVEDRRKTMIRYVIQATIYSPLAGFSSLDRKLVDGEMRLVRLPAAKA